MQKSIFSIIFASLCLITCQINAAIKPTQTLLNVVQETLAQNPNVLRTKAQAKAATHAITQARGQFLPTLTLSAAAGREQSRSPSTSQNKITLNRTESSVSVTQPIFSGFSSYNFVKQRGFEAKSAKANVLDEQQATALKATQVYLDELRLAKIHQLALVNVNHHQEILKKAKMLFKGGASRKSDLDLATGRVAQAQSTLKAVVGAQEDADAAFVNVVGLSPQKLVLPKIPNKYVPKTLARTLRIAFRYNPALKVAKYTLNASKSAVNASKGRFAPQINLQLSTSRGNNLDGVKGRNKDLQGMVVASYNLINGGIDYATTMQLASKRKAAMFETDRVRRELIKNVTQAWDTLQTDKKRLRELLTHVNSSKQVVEGYKQQFELGRRSLLNLLDVENEFFNANVSYVNGLYAVRNDTYALLANIGVLIQTLHMQH